VSERILRTLDVDGHDIAIIEDLEEDGPVYLLAVDDAVINADAPLPTIPSDRDIARAVRRWLMDT
jgi:hypothetical protein